MSRHVEMLRQAKLDGELFGRAASPENENPVPEAPFSPNGVRGVWQQLVHELFARRAQGSRSSVALASATAGEGASYVAAELAGELARSSGPTLLVEANVYRPALAERFGVEPDPGLRHLLADSRIPMEDGLRQTAVERLWLLPAGSVSNGSNETDWSHFRGLYQGLRERFRTIVGDLPPINLSPDFLILGPVFDGAVLVVQANLCSREVIQHAAARLRRANANVLGTVLNKRKLFVPTAVYRRL